MQVHFEGYVGDLWTDGKKYSLKQIHWHTPAEHQIDGKIYPAALHVVHEADDGSVAVVASIFNYGRQDPLIQEIKPYLNKLAGPNTKGNKIPIGKLDTKYLRQNTQRYYRYRGSLTTPPCTEAVLWSVLPEVLN
ncbi:hypothetical protein Patl1_25719 [Pistacia atlantica]|uniref:Uncharacterized protein n=1 Tax=Pistacia atlantica TaxID=434234 RepID=A0ACC1B424_9ROSI|nr:hypothetical protein Patl1_25719 [Pistacia atlantica]